MIPLLLDQGLPRSTAGILRGLGWDVQHVGEVGLAAATDSILIEHASQLGRTICTLDADFHAILALSGQSQPSVIRIRREGLRGNDLANLLRKIEPQIRSAVLAGAAITVTESAIRVRFLPIRPTER